MYFDVDGASLVANGPEMVQRPTVLLLHGGPGIDHSAFKPAYGRMADYAQVIYVDHSSQGRSDPTPPDRWTLDAWADDVIGLCDALEIERPIVLGWSFGGMVAMNLAGRYPNRLSKLVLQSTAARMNLDAVVEAFRALGGDEVAQAARDFWTTQSPESLQLYMETCLQHYSPGPPDMDSMAKAVLTPELLAGGWTEAQSFDLTEELANVSVPTLVLSGKLDPITPPNASALIMEHLPDGKATLESFSESGHAIPDTEPDRFFQILEEFITS